MTFSTALLAQEKSVALREPRCAHFGECGGCQSQQFEYSYQLLEKQAYLQGLFHKLEETQTLEMPPLIPSPCEWFYRNKMEFTFSRATSGRVVCGLHKRGSFAEIVPLTSCFLFSSIGDEIRKRVETLVNDIALSAYHPKTHEGFLRNLVIRAGSETGEILVNLVTNGFHDWNPERFVALFQDIPQVVSVYWSANTSKADAVILEETRLLSGRSFFYERIGDVTVKVNPQSFAQTNTLAAAGMYRWLMEQVKHRSQKPAPRLLDLYSGSGGIALFLASVVREAIGVDLVPASIEMATENAALNRLTNCHFIAADVRDYLKGVATATSDEVPFDWIVLDPPRAGVPPKVLKQVMALHPSYLLYVSCEPKGLVKNLKQLFKEYQLVTLQAFDFFPHTKHIETAVLLTAQ